MGNIVSHKVKPYEQIISSLSTYLREIKHNFQKLCARVIIEVLVIIILTWETNQIIFNSIMDK